MSIKWHGIIQPTSTLASQASLIKDDKEDTEDDEDDVDDYEDTLLKTADLGDHTKRPFFMNAMCVISHFVNFASARSDEC